MEVTTEEVKDPLTEYENALKALNELIESDPDSFAYQMALKSLSGFQKTDDDQSQSKT